MNKEMHELELRYPVGQLEGMRVEVYRNLNNGKWSVRSLEGEYRGYVIAYADKVALNDVEFYVSATGRAKVLRNRVKMVHATVRGKFVGTEVAEASCEDVSVYYDPYKVDTFVDRSDMSALTSRYERVDFLEDKRVFIKRTD